MVILTRENVNHVQIPVKFVYLRGIVQNATNWRSMLKLTFIVMLIAIKHINTIMLLIAMKHALQAHMLITRMLGVKPVMLFAWLAKAMP